MHELQKDLDAVLVRHVYIYVKVEEHWSVVFWIRAPFKFYYFNGHNT